MLARQHFDKKVLLTLDFSDFPISNHDYKRYYKRYQPIIANNSFFPTT